MQYRDSMCVRTELHMPLLWDSELVRKVREGRGQEGREELTVELVECTRRDPG